MVEDDDALGTGSGVWREVLRAGRGRRSRRFHNVPLLAMFFPILLQPEPNRCNKHLVLVTFRPMAFIGVNAIVSIHLDHLASSDIASEGYIRIFALGTIRSQALAAWEVSFWKV